MKNENETKAPFIVLAILLWLLETFIFLLFLIDVFNIFMFLILHFIILLIVLYFNYFSYKNQKDMCYPILLFLAQFGGGPFGLSWLLLQLLVQPLFFKFAQPAFVWLRDLFPEKIITSFEYIYLRIKSGWDDYGQLKETTTFEDIFNHGNLAQKQAILDVIVKDFHPIYAPILLQGLNDPHNTVRIQSAAIVSKIESDFEEKIIDLETKYQESSHQPDLALELAEHYTTYTALDFLDSERKRELRSSAIHFYKEYLKYHPNDMKVLISIGSLLFHSHDYENFISWYKDYHHHFKSIPKIMQSWYLESLYKTQDYKEFSKSRKEFLGG